MGATCHLCNTTGRVGVTTICNVSYPFRRKISTFKYTDYNFSRDNTRGKPPGGEGGETMTTNRRADDPAHADRAWYGYHPRAAIPAVAVAGAASLAVVVGRWALEDLSQLADRVGALAVFALAWCFWPAFAAVYLYRTVTYSYRLTDRALLIDFGFRHRPVPPVPLSEVAEVRAGAGWLDRLLGVGWIEVRTTAGRRVRLVGVRRPEEVAHAIRGASKS